MAPVAPASGRDAGRIGMRITAGRHFNPPSTSSNECSDNKDRRTSSRPGGDLTLRAPRQGPASRRRGELAAFKALMGLWHFILSQRPQGAAPVCAGVGRRDDRDGRSARESRACGRRIRGNDRLAAAQGRQATQGVRPRARKALPTAKRRERRKRVWTPSSIRRRRRSRATTQPGERETHSDARESLWLEASCPRYEPATSDAAGAETLFAWASRARCNKNRAVAPRGRAGAGMR